MRPGLRTINLNYEKLAPTLKFMAMTNEVELGEEWLEMVYRGPLPGSIFIFTGRLFGLREVTVADLQQDNERSGHPLPKWRCSVTSSQRFHAWDLCVLALTTDLPFWSVCSAQNPPGPCSFPQPRTVLLPSRLI